LNNTIWGNGVDVLDSNNPSCRTGGAGISLNKGSDHGSTTMYDEPHVLVRNNILWANVCDSQYVPDTSIHEFYAEHCVSWTWYARYHLEYNCIKDWRGDYNDTTHHRLENNNITGNPQFADDSGDDLCDLDFHLSTSPNMSSCLDAGLTIPSLRDDLDLHSRPQGSTHDIGAYEYGTDSSAAGLRAVTIKDSAGFPVLQFWSDGNVFLSYGAIVSEATSGQLTPTGAKEFIVKQDDTVVVRLAVEAANLYLMGEPSKVPNLTSDSNTAETVFRNTQDTGNNVQILIDAEGNLKFRGDIYINGQLVTP